MKRLTHGFIFLLIVLLLAGCLPTPTPTPSPTSPPPTATTRPQGIILRMGDISDDPGEVITGMQPLADYLVAHLADYGVTGNEIQVTRTADEMIELFKQGQVDLYFDSVYPATLIGDASGAQPVLRRWRRGSDQYHSVLFGLADSGITSPDDLLGKMIAMDNPFSTSGYMLPAATLLEQGYKLSVKETYEDPVAEDEIGIVFSYDDENTFQWVVSGLVSAGATDNVSYESFSADLDTGLSIFAETRPVPRQVVLMRSDIDPALAAAIIDLLINISDDPQAQAVLQAFDGTTRFDEFPEGLAAAQEQMRSMMELVKQIKLPE